MATAGRRGNYKAHKAVLKPLDSQQIDALILAVVDAYSNGRENINLKVSYLTKFADDFPKGVCYLREGLFNYHRIKANRLVKWLNAHGYFKPTPFELRGLLISHGKKYKEMFNP